MAVEVVVIVAMVAMVSGKTPIPVVVALEVGSDCKKETEDTGKQQQNRVKIRDCQFAMLKLN